MYLRSLAATLMLVAFSAVTATAQTVLVMVEEAGCQWCARFNAEIADTYPKTVEGKAAPLQRVNIHGPYPEDMEFDGQFRFTPTFVLMVNGKEVSRMEGYPGEDFFWGMLDRMLTEADLEPVSQSVQRPALGVTPAY